MQSDVEQSRNIAADADNVSLSVAATTSPLHSGARHSYHSAHSHSTKKRQHLSDSSVLKKTPRTDESRMLTSAEMRSIHHGEDAVDSSAARAEDMDTVHDVETSIQCSEDAVEASTPRGEDIGTVNDVQGICAMASVETSTEHCEDVGSAHDAESYCATAAVVTSTQHGEDAGIVESHYAMAAVVSSTQHDEDAGIVDEDAGIVDEDAVRSDVVAAAALSSTHTQRETVSRLSRVEHEIAAAASMQSVAGDEYPVIADRSMQTSAMNVELG